MIPEISWSSRARMPETARRVSRKLKGELMVEAILIEAIGVDSTVSRSGKRQ
jgi:hypothetical protein